MAEQLAARQNQQWTVVSTVPDVCRTPVGNTIVPVPYPVISFLDNSIDGAASVRVNGEHLILFDQSVVLSTVGADAGSHKGCKSGTVGGRCYPKTRSQSVRSQSRCAVRNDDEFWMNAP